MRYLLLDAVFVDREGVFSKTVNHRPGLFIQDQSVERYKLCAELYRLIVWVLLPGCGASRRERDEKRYDEQHTFLHHNARGSSALVETILQLFAGRLEV